MRNKGITLVALVITVIILLILAGVAISMITGVDGFIGRANQSAELYNNAALNEAERLNSLLNEEYSNNTDGNENSNESENENENDEPTIPYPSGEWDEVAKVNTPEIKGTGLIPVVINGDGTHKELTGEQAKSTKWYDYSQGSRQWANAVTKNDKNEVTGYFVWIPRYEYQISGQTINVNFVPTEKTTPTAGYIIHPVFRNEKSANYANGGWDDEISGFWVSKFEAGYAGKGKGDTNNQVTAVDSGITYTGATPGTNYYGSITSGSTPIKYPVFLPKTYSYTSMNIGDMYNISREIEEAKSYYGLEKADSHMMKNSEWGAVAYLTQSKYGRNGTEVTINNVNMNNQVATIYGITGYAGHEISAGANNLTSTALGNTATGNLTSHAWNTPKGVLGSSTGNVHGVYDLSGGLREYTAGYINNTNGANYRSQYGGGLVSETNNKYKSIYANSSSDTEAANYSQSPNPSRRGEAIWETSTNGNSYTGSWNGDHSEFIHSSLPFTIRGGSYYYAASAGVFAFNDAWGSASDFGFRVALVALAK